MRKIVSGRIEPQESCFHLPFDLSQQPHSFSSLWRGKVKGLGFCKQKSKNLTLPSECVLWPGRELLIPWKGSQRFRGWYSPEANLGQ